MIHGQTPGINSHLAKQLLQMADSLRGIGVSLQEMALPLQSPGNEKAVNAAFKGPQHINMIQFAGAGQADNLDIGRIR